MVLANAYSHLRFVVQDRPNVVAVAPSVTPSSPTCLDLLLMVWCVALRQIERRSHQFRARLVHGTGLLPPATRLARRPWRRRDLRARSLPHPRLRPQLARRRGLQVGALILPFQCPHTRCLLTARRSCRMLGLLRSRAAPTTQLLIVDTVLPHACVDSTSDPTSAPIPGALRTLVPNGSPLLANLGRAHASLYQLDICVRAVTPVWLMFSGGGALADGNCGCR